MPAMSVLEGFVFGFGSSPLRKVETVEPRVGWRGTSTITSHPRLITHQNYEELRSHVGSKEHIDHLKFIFNTPQSSSLIMSAISFRQLVGAQPSTASPSDSALIIIDAQNEYAKGDFLRHLDEKRLYANA